MSTTGPTFERQPHPQGGIWGRLREVVHQIRPRAYTLENHSKLGYAIAEGLESAMRMDKVLPVVLSLGEALVGSENPQQEVRKEIGILAERLTAHLPEDLPSGSRRRGDSEPAIREFKADFVDVVEELVNGTTSEGQPSQLPLLSRAVKNIRQELPQSLQGDLFMTGQDGRLHLRNDQEFGAIGRMRQLPVIGKVINGLLPQESPLTAKRGFEAFAGDFALGVIGGQYLALPKDTQGRDILGNKWNWLYRHRVDLDPQLLGLLDSKKIQAVELAAPERASTITLIKDVRKFLADDLPNLYPKLVQLLPTNHQETEGFAQLFKAFRKISAQR